MKNNFRRLLGFGWALAVWVGLAQAGTIQLQIKSSIKLSADLLAVQLEVVNHGNEAARAVKPILWIGNHPQALQGRDQLFPGEVLKVAFRTKRHPFQERGAYYLPLHLEYRDQSGSLFKLPYLLQMNHGEHNQAGLRTKVSQAILPTDDFIEVTLTNTEPWRKTVHFSKYMAMQFKIDLPPSPFELKGNESHTWQLNIKHDTLWPNTYVSYLIAEYSHEGQHYSHPIPLTMQVTAEAVKSAWFFSRMFMTNLLVGLVVIALIGGYGPFIYKRLWQKHS